MTLVSPKNMTAIATIKMAGSTMTINTKFNTPLTFCREDSLTVVSNVVPVLPACTKNVTLWIFFFAFGLPDAYETRDLKKGK